MMEIDNLMKSLQVVSASLVECDFHQDFHRASIFVLMNCLVRRQYQLMIVLQRKFLFVECLWAIIIQLVHVPYDLNIVSRYRGGSPTAVQAWQPCPLWELSPSHPVLL